MNGDGRRRCCGEATRRRRGSCVAAFFGFGLVLPLVIGLTAAASGAARLEAARSSLGGHTAPVASGAAFSARVQTLWRGVQSGNAKVAESAFFPESAYLALKQIANPASDFTERLLADYDLDIAAAHRLLLPDPAQAHLLRVEVDPAYAHYVPAGVCSNGLGYYELPNTRLVYSLRGQLRSFGIASMISWRGQWYVVHLGAVLRSAAVGIVDDPSLGAGVVAYSGTC